MTKKQHLFENYNDAAYDNTTDPFAAILEGPKFTFGNTNKDVVNGDSEEGDEAGRTLAGSPVRSSHSLTDDELEHQRDQANALDGDELVDKELPDELETQADELIHKASMSDPAAAWDGQISKIKDAMNYTDDIGDFDIAGRDEELDNAAGEFGLGGYNIVKPEENASEAEVDDQFGLDNPEGVLGDVEPDEPELPIATPDSDVIALHNISDEELMKELQFRMANKLKA